MINSLPLFKLAKLAALVSAKDLVLELTRALGAEETSNPKFR